jgi:hypothetical protein
VSCRDDILAGATLPDGDPSAFTQRLDLLDLLSLFSLGSVSFRWSQAARRAEADLERRLILVEMRSDDCTGARRAPVVEFRGIVMKGWVLFRSSRFPKLLVAPGIIVAASGRILYEGEDSRAVSCGAFAAGPRGFFLADERRDAAQRLRFARGPFGRRPWARDMAACGSPGRQRGQLVR